MAETITDVHGVASAAGWFFEDFGLQEIGDFKAVMTLALVSVFNDAYPALGTKKIVVPVSADSLYDDLIGSAVSSADIVHENELRARFGN